MRLNLLKIKNVVTKSNKILGNAYSKKLRHFSEKYDLCASYTPQNY